jgi:DNA-binding GntR family transcriptional regulator
MSKKKIPNAYEHLRRKLVEGEILPGMRLGNRKLAQEMGVSYTPVREALSRLISEGFVEHIRGVGAYVRMPDAREIEELLSIREVLESHAVAEAIRQITADELKVLDSVCSEWLAVLRANRTFQFKRKQLDRWIYLDQLFHETIILAAKNRLLTKFMRDQRLLEKVFGSLRLETAGGSKTVSDFSNVSWPRIWRQHAALVRAIRRRNVKAARYWIHSQIADSKKQFEAFFKYKFEVERQGRDGESTLEAVRRYSTPRGEG